MPILVDHLITDLESGGAQMALYRLVTRLDRELFTPRVVCLRGGDGPVGRKLRAAGVPVLDLRMTRKWRVDALALLYGRWRRERPVILHSWMFHATLIGRLVGRAAGIPILISARRNVNIGGPWRERLNRLTLPLDNAVIAVCETARAAEIAHGHVAPEKVTTIYNGVDLAEFPRASAEAGTRLRRVMHVPAFSPLIGVVGRLHPQKGHTYLLQALPAILQAIPDAHFLMIGDGELRQALAQEARQLGVARQVHWLGHRDDVPALLAGLDLFVLPSLWEGMPNVVLEAMAAGLPVVATGVDGTREVIVDGETGMLVGAGEVPALAQAIIHLLQDRDRAAALGQAAHAAVAAHFTLQRTVQQTEELYRRLLGE
ncbi:MAG: glycosyltransferase [Ardenticatenales bacterium]|nr:glycosyltransferase [Ardenticatenales bacterium]